jgi:hypothetical protein
MDQNRGLSHFRNLGRQPTKSDRFLPRIHAGMAVTHEPLGARCSVAGPRRGHGDGQLNRLSVAGSSCRLHPIDRPLVEELFDEAFEVSSLLHQVTDEIPIQCEVFGVQALQLPRGSGPVFLCSPGDGRQAVHDELGAGFFHIEKECGKSRRLLSVEIGLSLPPPVVEGLGTDPSRLSRMAERGANLNRFEDG